MWLRVVAPHLSQITISDHEEGGLEASFARGRERIVAEITGLIEGVWRGGTPEKLLTALVHDLRVPGAGEFLSTLEDILRSPAGGQVEVWAWQRVIAHLRLRVLPWIASDPLLVSRAENLWLSASVQVGDQALSRRGPKARSLRASLTNSRALLPGAHRCHRYGRVWPRWWAPVSPISGCLAVGSPFTTTPRRRSDRRTSRCRATKMGASSLHLSLRISNRAGSFPEGSFSSGTPFMLVCAPLSFKSEQLGFVLFGVGSGEANVYDDLPQQLSSAIMRVKREEELARLYVAQQERSRELEEAYRATKENHERLLTSAQMAALGRLTAGMAHEMNTPLAAVRRHRRVGQVGR